MNNLELNMIDPISKIIEKCLCAVQMIESKQKVAMLDSLNCKNVTRSMMRIANLDVKSN